MKVRPFLHWQKNDIDDAAAIVEADHHPTMHFVAVTSEAAQGVAVLCSTAASQRAIAINAVIARFIMVMTLTGRRAGRGRGRREGCQDDFRDRKQNAWQQPENPAVISKMS